MYRCSMNRRIVPPTIPEVGQPSWEMIAHCLDPRAVRQQEP